MIYGADGQVISTAGKNRRPLHWASAERAEGFISLMDTLPDPDEVLRKKRLTTRELHKLLVDDHLAAVWETRTMAVRSAAWGLTAGESASEKSVGFFSELLTRLDVEAILSGFMDAAAYGFAPFEMITVKDGNYITLDALAGKPEWWFGFDAHGNLVLKNGFYGLGREAIPPEVHFLLVSHKATYENPYGEKIFSRCYWPVKFKQKGWDWFVRFVEKFGSLFLVGEYPKNAEPGYENDLLDSLYSIIGSGAAAVEEGTVVNKLEASDKAGSASVYKTYIDMAERAVSKAVLGQTLTTDSTSSSNTNALGTIHNEVRKERAAADRRFCAGYMNRLIQIVSRWNFGDAPAPVFEFAKEEELFEGRAERDGKLHALGVRFTKKYFTRYGLEEDDYEVAKGEVPAAEAAGIFSGEEKPVPYDPAGGKRRFSLFFAKKSKGEKTARRYRKRWQKKGLAALKAMGGSAVRSVQEAGSCEEAAQSLLSQAGAGYGELAEAVKNVRYVSGVLGERDG